MPIWAFQKRIIGNPTPEKAAFVSSFADCDELFVINQRFPKYFWIWDFAPSPHQRAFRAFTAPVWRIALWKPSGAILRFILEMSVSLA